MTLKDHLIVMVFTLFIYISLSLFLSTNLLYCLVGAFLLSQNWAMFERYCNFRKFND